jgi:hypothetical protein
MVLVILEVQVRSDPNRATDLKASQLDIHDLPPCYHRGVTYFLDASLRGLDLAGWVY